MKRHRYKKTKKFRIPPILIKFSLISLIIISLFLLIFNVFFKNRTATVLRELTPQEGAIVQREKILVTINEILLKYGIRNEWISQSIAIKTIRIPASVPILQLCQEIATETTKLGAEIWKSYEDLQNKTIILELGYDNQLLQNIKFIPDARLVPEIGKIVLIIDDFGYSITETVERFLKLDIPFDVAIIPGIEHSTEIAEMAILNQKEIIIHLPMEPKDSEEMAPNRYTILTSMAEPEIRERIRQAYRLLPAAVGVNNHQGSKAMADSFVVEILINELSQHNLFFIDSRTCADSKGYESARAVHLPTAKRDIFLDDEETTASIQKQLYKLARLARKYGIAVGIGHVKAKTLEVLEKEIPELKRLGYEFHYASMVLK